LGAQVQFVSVAGDDDVRNYALDHLLACGVNAHLLIDDTRPTTLKQRFRSGGKVYFRVSHLHQGSISVELQQEMILSIERVMERVDLIVFSDFNYGCLPQALVDKVV
jgi:bifunctional ADP-heptose synthase (sugar kinase/adenylyltransferase)